MPQVTPGDVHVDQWLTNISVAFVDNQYIADEIFPIVPVNNQSDLFLTYDRSHWYRDDAHLRAPGTASRGGGLSYGQDNYFCHRYSYRTELDDLTRRNADSVFNLERDRTQFVTSKLQLRREVALATEIFTTGVWDTDEVGGTDFDQWSDYDLSTPLQDMTLWMDEIELAIGREPNTLVWGKPVWNILKWHPDLIDVVKNVQRGMLTLDLVRELFEVERILIGRALRTTDPEGTPEANVTYSRIWGNDALLLYVPANPSLLTPASGYTFVWQAVPNALQYIKRMRNEEREVDIFEGNTFFDHKVTSALSGKFLSNLVA